MGWDELLAVYNGSAERAKDRKFRVLIYGSPGSGKTTLAATFPKPFFIDADRGMSSLRGMDIPFVQLGKDAPFGQLYGILSDALNGAGPFAPDKALGDVQTIVLDSFSAIADDYLLGETMREAGRNLLRDKASYDEYGKLKQRLIALSNLLKDLSSRYYIVSTALVDEEKNENTGDLRGKPLMTGKYRDKIGADYDEEWYLESITSRDGQRYVLHAADYRWFEAKTRNLRVVSMDDPSFAKVIKEFK